MRSRKSHGWLDSTYSRFLLVGMPAAIALGLGLHAAYRGSVDARESMIRAQGARAQAEARHYLGRFWDSIEIIRNQALYIQKVADDLPGRQASMGKILHWAEFTVQDDSLIAVRRSLKNPEWKVSEANALSLASSERTYEGAYLAHAMKAFKTSELRKQQVQFLSVSMGLHRSGNWLAMAFPSPRSADSVIIALVDPTEVFRAYRVPAVREGLKTRAYVIDDRGWVLSHTQPNYQQSDFSGSPLFAHYVSPILRAKRMPGYVAMGAMDRLPVIAAAVRPASLPVALVVEVIQPEVAVAWSRYLSRAMAGGILAVLLAWGAAWYLRRREDDWEDKAPLPPLMPLFEAPIIRPAAPRRASEATSAAEFTQGIEVLPIASLPPQERLQEAIERQADGASTRMELRRELSASSEALRSIEEEARLVAKFQSEAARARDPRAVAARLTEAASKLSASPTLYFTYHERHQAAVLHSAAGFPLGQSPTAMSFPISHEVVLRLSESGSRVGGAYPSLSQHEPLADLLLSRLNVAHFEAWVLTGQSELGRLAGKCRVHGVLIILQSGMESVARHESLCKMLEVTGSSYENGRFSP